MHAPQDIAGDWQGTLKAGPQGLRLILKIEKTAGRNWRATLFSIDQSPDWGAGIPVDSVTLQDSSLKMAVGALRGTYEGKVSADGNSIEGSWTQGPLRPLEFQRPTPETRRGILRMLRFRCW